MKEPYSYLLEYEVEVPSRTWGEFYWQHGGYETRDLEDAREHRNKRLEDHRYRNFRLYALVKEPLDGQR